MPTDNEIRAIISQFGFEQEQQEVLFKETKKKLQDMHSSQNLEKTNAELNQYLRQVDNGSMDEVLNSSIKQELKQGVSQLPTTTGSKSAKVKAAAPSSEKKSEKGFRSQSKSFKSQKAK